MKGAMAIFLMVCITLLIDLIYDLSYSLIDLFVAEDFFCRIHEKHIQTAFDSQVVLLLSIAFADSSLQHITLYGTLEELFRYGYHDPVLFVSGAFKAEIAHVRHIAVLTFGKKLRNAGLAAQSFFFRKSITGICFH